MHVTIMPWYCLRNRHATMMDIAKWAWEYFGKPLSLNKVCCCCFWEKKSAKDEKDHPDCYQRKVQKPAPVMVWGCISAQDMGDLHICEGTIDAEAYVRILERHMLPSRQLLFPGTLCPFLQDNARPHSTQVKTAWLHRHRVCVLVWPACLQSRSVSDLKCMAYHEEENQTTVTTDF